MSDEMKRCPFCNVKSTIHGPLFAEAYRCGTRRAFGDDDYMTGDECDKVCFRNGLLEATAKVEELQAENQRLRHGLSKVNEEVCQTLGKALGYPWFKDDQTNFPGSTEEHGVCVGDHVAESIAVEAARTLKGVQAENQRLREALQSIVKHQELVSGNMSNMSATRTIALKALEERQ